MSSIFALHADAHTEIEPRQIEQITAGLDHTRTEARRVWHAESQPLRVGLGLLRQSFTEEDRLETPWTSTSGSVTLVCDARLDNRDNLARQLGVTLDTGVAVTDGELLLGAYVRWGQDCTRYLRGDFAFIAWDQQRQRLFCATDQRGNRTLFHHSGSGLLIVASSPQGILRLPGVERQLNEQSLAQHLALCGRPDATFYQGIKRLPAGHHLTAHGTQIKVQRYWQLDPEQRIHHRRDQDYIDDFLQHFDHAVASRLRTNGKLGILLSGGLDSSAVAALATPHIGRMGQRLHAFTAVPAKSIELPPIAGKYSDETPLVSAIAAQLPELEIHWIDSGGRSPLDGLDNLFEDSGAPMRNNCNRLWLEHSLEQARALGITAMLSGQTGNATVSFNGHPRLAKLLAGGRWLRLRRELKGLAANLGLPFRSLLLRQAVAPLLPPSWWSYYIQRKDGRRDYLHSISAVNPAISKAYELEQHFHQTFGQVPEQAGRDSRRWRMAWLDSPAVVDATDLTRGWRQRYGIDLRDPTADIDLMAFCLALPEDQYLRDGQDRRLIRRAMAGMLPPQVLSNTAMGMQSPDWFLNLKPMRQQIACELSRLEHSETAQRLIDLPRLKRMVDDWPEDRWHDPDVWTPYRFTLQRALMVGRFIRWFESHES